MPIGQVLQSYTYVDGGYLRAEGTKISIPYPNPRMFALWAN